MEATPPPTPGMDRRDLLRLAGLLGALLAVTAVVLVATGGGSSEKSAGPTGQATVEGVLTQVTPTMLVLQPNDGRAQMTFSIRPEVSRTLDLFHLRQHSSDQLPSRVLYETDGGTMYALRVDDA